MNSLNSIAAAFCHSFLQKGSLVIPGSPVELVNIDRDTTLKIEIDKVGSLTTRMEKLDI